MQSSFVTSKMVERVLGLKEQSMSAIAFLVMQEQAQGRSLRSVAEGLDVSESDIDELADSITEGEGGTKNELWRNGVAYIRSTLIGNQQIMARTWDSLEAMTLETLASKVQSAGAALSTKDALAIAQVANKALRRHNGEGQSRNQTNVSIVNRPTGMGEEDMSLELRSGHMGSIRLSLSSRVRAQLERPVVIEGEVKRAEEREMLDLDSTRKLVNGQ